MALLDGLKEAPIAVWLFALIGVLGAVGIIVNTAIGDTIESESSFSILNETITAASTSSNTTLAVKSISNLTSITVFNASEWDAMAIVSDGNWTVYPVDIIPGDSESGEAVAFNFILISGTSWSGANLNISYTGSDTNQQGNVIKNATLGISNTTKQLPTVGTIIGVLIIVTAVVGLMGVFQALGPGRGMY